MMSRPWKMHLFNFDNYQAPGPGKGTWPFWMMITPPEMHLANLDDDHDPGKCTWLIWMLIMPPGNAPGQFG
jgi:hypothetical protein